MTSKLKALSGFSIIHQLQGRGHIVSAPGLTACARKGNT